jgi:glycerol-3-phosphate dehydrogenase (NAD(P)+)
MKIGIYGAGAFGTALAIYFTRLNFSLRWLCFEEAEAKRINRERKTPLDVKLPQNLVISSSNHFGDLDVLFWVVPSDVVKESLSQAKEHIPPSLPMIICSKGMVGHAFLHEALATQIPNTLLFMGGPNLALEIAKGYPFEAMLASNNFFIAENLSTQLSHSISSFYPTIDVIGVQLCGILKNIYAIGAGILLGQGKGRNMHASFFSKALQEMMLVGNKFKAKPETILGIAGLSDLVLTGSQEHSRNMSFGIKLGMGESAHDILKNRTMVTEGVMAAQNIAPHIQDLNTPILKHLCAVLQTV